MLTPGGSLSRLLTPVPTRPLLQTGQGLAVTRKYLITRAIWLDKCLKYNLLLTPPDWPSLILPASSTPRECIRCITRCVRRVYKDVCVCVRSVGSRSECPALHVSRRATSLAGHTWGTDVTFPPCGCTADGLPQLPDATTSGLHIHISLVLSLFLSTRSVHYNNLVRLQQTACVA